MTPENFCYWLKGYFEITGYLDLNAERSKVVKEHLNLVFGKKPQSITFTSQQGESGVAGNLITTDSISVDKLFC